MSGSEFGFFPAGPPRTPGGADTSRRERPLAISADRNRGEAESVDNARPGTSDDLQLPEQLTKPNRGWQRWAIALLVAAALAAAYFRFLAPAKADHPYRVSPVEKRAIRQTVEAFGSLDVLSRVYVPAAR